MILQHGKSMKEYEIRDDFIKLGQLLKAAGLVDSGVEAKFVIQDGLVKVNGSTELQRGKKLYDQDVVQYEQDEIKVIKRKS